MTTIMMMLTLEPAFAFDFIAHMWTQRHDRCLIQLFEKTPAQLGIDTYTISTANGQTRKFWERNIRLKTDSSSDGPEKNAPGLVPGGMMGDRADIIFAAPSEISGFIKPEC
jgi:hypothetical protein